MSYNSPQDQSPQTPDQQAVGSRFAPLVNLLLFVVTFFTTTVAGVQWIGKDPFELTNFHYGLPYSTAILFVLGVHEFGHYFAARLHRVNVTLPFFIPFPPTPFFLNFGTLGALIRTKAAVPSRKAMFDIGVAGPLAGFVACIILLTIGFTHLPGPEYLTSIHPGYDFSQHTTNESQGISLEFGSTILYRFLSWLLTDPSRQFIPPMSEMYHYPLLCVGWFGLFVTAMNLIPIGQYDGGHLIYTLLGDKHRTIARSSFFILIALGFPSVLDSVIRSIAALISDQPLGQVIPFAQYSWSGWFLWAMISYYVVKLYHPPVFDETPLNGARQIIGWLTVLVFIVSFSLTPFSISL